MHYVDKVISILNDMNVLNDELFNELKLIDDKMQLADRIEKCLCDPDLYLVYKHTDPKGKVYIGITQNHPQTRWNDGTGYKTQTKFYRAIQKYGWINFKHEIIEAGINKDEALALENKYILEYKTYDDNYGYNVRINNNLNDAPQLTEIQNHGQRRNGKNRSNIDNSIKNIDICEISEALVRKYGVVTVRNIIYFIIDGHYFKEEEKHLIARELISVYKIPSKKHNEIFEMIKILSCTDIDKIPNELQENDCSDTKSIFDWIVSCGYDIVSLTSVSTDMLYLNYVEWCGLENKSCGKKTFYKILSGKYKLMKKQKSDGKRYFIEK